jgi:hypothetical protein
MRKGTYRKPFDKVHKRVQRLLPRMDFDIINDDALKSGIITAKRKGNLFTSAIMLEINITKIDEDNTQLSVKTSRLKHFFKGSEYKLVKIEEGIVNKIV